MPLLYAVILRLISKVITDAFCSLQVNVTFFEHVKQLWMLICERLELAGVISHCH